MEPTVYISPTPFYKNRLFLVLIFIAILILIPLSFYLFKIYFLKAPQIKPGLNEGELPVALEILQNPMVYEWRGSVEGTLTAKDDKSITLKRDGKKITVPVDPSATKFLPQSAIVQGELNKSLTFEEIAINDYLQGDFFVFPNENGKMVGSSFIVKNK